MRAVKKEMALLCAALCLTLSGCGNVLLERSWSSVEPHSAGYWENGDRETLRADSYQELVNALLLLVDNHAESGVVRIYDSADQDAAQMAADACTEVQQETAPGAYLLDYITYSGTEERGFYELTVHFGYRHTAEEQQAIIHATSTEAIPDLLRTAAEEGTDHLVVQVNYFASDRAGVEEMVESVFAETAAAAEETAEPWQVVFYPDVEEPGIVEILLK